MPCHIFDLTLFGPKSQPPTERQIQNLPQAGKPTVVVAVAVVAVAVVAVAVVAVAVVVVVAVAVIDVAVVVGAVVVVCQEFVETLWHQEL